MCKFRKWHKASYKNRSENGNLVQGIPEFEHEQLQKLHWCLFKIIDTSRRKGKTFKLTFQQIADDLYERTGLKTAARTVRGYFYKWRDESLLGMKQCYRAVMKFEILNLDGLKAKMKQIDDAIRAKREECFGTQDVDLKTQDVDLKTQDVDIYLNTSLNSSLKTHTDQNVCVKEDKRVDQLFEAATFAVAFVTKGPDSAMADRIYSEMKDENRREAIRNPRAYALTRARFIQNQSKMLSYASTSVVSREEPKPAHTLGGRFDDLINSVMKREYSW